MGFNLKKHFSHWPISSSLDKTSLSERRIPMAYELKKSLDESDHFLGPLNAQISIVEYGDYECPYTMSFHSDVIKLLKEFEGLISYAYRHFPLKGIHEHSHLAARAAEAASIQGKFWEMHSILMVYSDELNFDFINLLARKIGLSMTEFEDDMLSSEVYEKVDQDIISGHYSGVESTPSLFINGVLYEGSSSLGPIREILEEFIYGGDRDILSP
jgi:protein-disulfide isomerase